MNRRDFLKFLGSLPLIGLAAKLPILQDDKRDIVIAEFEDGLTLQMSTSEGIRVDGYDCKIDWCGFDDVIIKPIDGRISFDDIGWKGAKFSVGGHHE